MFDNGSRVRVSFENSTDEVTITDPGRFMGDMLLSCRCVKNN